MRLLFLLSLIYIPVSCFTQITLNNPDFSDAGDTVRVSIAVPDSSIDYFTTGPNQNWDFVFIGRKSRTSELQRCL